jgi:hypothetical protein
MTEPRSQYLFHYTPKFEFLQSSLRHGFWPRYCEEDYSALFQEPGQRFWLAFPVVCFTDIPPAAAMDHMDRYGMYAIQLSKDYASHADPQSMLYVLAGSRIAAHFKDQILANGRRPTSPDAIANPLFRLLPFVKLTPGSQRSRNDREAWEVQAFEDEMEWRYLAEVPELPVVADYGTAGFVKEHDNEKSRSHPLAVAQKYIEAVFVLTCDELALLQTEFPGLNGKIQVRT